MNLEKIPLAKNFPELINVVIEISMGANPVKYEIDKDSGALFVDRFIQTSMYYPCNYGFIPKTLGGDGDPIDVLVHAPFPVLPNSVILSRPIGVLIMEDESGLDEKILAVPASKLDPSADQIKNYSDLPELFINKISHFFENYKKLEKNKWVKIIAWEDQKSALEIIKKSLIKI